MRGSEARRLRRSVLVGAVLVLGGGLLAQGCSSRDVVGVDVASVAVEPAELLLEVGQTGQLSADARTGDGTPLPASTVDWSSNAPSVVSVTGTGRVEAHQPGSATITARVQDVTGTAIVLVQELPRIGASPGQVQISAPRGGERPEPVEVAITNAGAGDLTGLGATVTYPAGQPGGWLTPGLSSTTAPATLTLQADPGTLPLGSWNAVVRIASPVAENSPLEIPVTLEVTEDRPILALSSSSIGMAAVLGDGRDPPPRTVQVTNAGGGVLGDLSVEVTYRDPETGWLEASLSDGTAPAEVTLQARTGSLTPGSYQADVDVSSPAAVNGSRTVAVTFTVFQEPIADLSVEKTGPGVALVEDTLEYAVQVVNRGPREAEEVVVVDSLPDGVAFVSATEGGTFSGSAVRWELGTLEDGEDRTLAVRAVAVAPGEAANVARLATATTDPVADNDRGVWSTEILPREADLVVDKTGPADASLGETIQYLVSVANVGPADAGPIVVVDSLPDEVSLVSATGSPDVVGGVLTWTFGDLSAGTQLSETVEVRVEASGVLENIARASGSVPDPSPDDARDRVLTSVDREADLAVAKSGPATADVGDTIRFVVDVENLGPDPAASVVVLDSLPDGVTFVEASGPVVVDGREVRWEHGDLAPGAGRADTVRVVVPELGQAANRAFARSGTIDPTPANDTSSTATQIEGADLSVDKDGPGSASVLEVVEYVLTVRNDGNVPAVSTVLVDSLPSNALFLSASGGGSLVGSAVVWDLNDLPPGSESVDTLRVMAVLPGAMENVARVSSDTPDVDTLDHRATTSSSLSGADLSVTKTGTAAADVGDTLVYVLTVANAGPDLAENVVLRDSLPSAVTLVEITGGGTASGRVVQWSKGDVPSGGGSVDSVRVVVDQPGAALNVARVSSPTADPDSVDRRATFTTSVEGAGVSVLKEGPSVVGVGDTITYTLTVGNVGPDAAADVVLVDSLPQGVSFLSASGGGSHQARVVTWSYGGDLSPGGQIVETLRVLADDPGSPRNVARVRTSTADPDATDQRDTLTTRVEGADLSVVKSGPATATVGDAMTYTLTVANAGPDPAASVVLSDTLPGGVTFVSASDGGTQSGGTVTWNLGTVASGANVVRTVNVTAATAGSALNRARVASPTSDPAAGNNRNQATTTISAAPLEADLSVSKSAPATATVGDGLTYTLTVSNAGPDPAENVQLSDTLPAGVTFMSASDGGSENAGTVTWSLGTVASGANVMRTVNVTAATAGSATNRARVTTTTADPVTSNDRDDATTTISAPTLEADLSVSKSAPATATVGDAMTYTLTVANAGPDPAASVQLSDTLPGSVTFVSASDGGTQSGGTVTWNLGTVASGANVVRTVNVTAATAGSALNRARVASPTSDPAAGNNRNEATTTISAAPLEADLSVSKSAPATATVGDGLTYTLTVSNAGPDPAENVQLSDTLPGGVTFVSASDGGTQSGGTVTWNLGTVASGANVVRTVNVTAATAGSATNRARVTTTTDDPVASNDRDDATTTISAPTPEADLSVSKSAPATATVGDAMTYTLTVANAGPDPAENVQLSDTLPAGVTFMSASDGGSENAGTVTWSLGTVASGANVVRSVQVTAATAGSATNRARVTTTTADPVASNDRDDATTTISAPTFEADLSVSLSGPAQAQVGETVTYDITVMNAGPDSAISVVVVDSIPGGMTFVLATGGGNLNGTAVTWEFGALAPGADRTRRLRLIPEVVGEHANRASVRSDSADPEGDDNRSELITIASAPSTLEGQAALVPPRGLQAPGQQARSR